MRKFSTGSFTIANIGSGRTVSLKDLEVVASDQPCQMVDQFTWEPDPDGLRGRIRSAFNGQYLSTGKNKWEKGIYLRDGNPESTAQKWEMADNQLVPMVSKEFFDSNEINLPLVLSHHQSELTLSDMACDNPDLHQWKLETVENSAMEAEIPDGKVKHGPF